MVNKIIILGGGNHARVLIDLITSIEKYEIVGILEDKINVGMEVSGVPVIGEDNMLANLKEKGVNNACIGVGAVKETYKRKSLYKAVKKLGFSCPPLLHPEAIISKKSRIKEGSQVMAGTIIQIGSVIGENAIINTGAVVDHDCVIGKHACICPRVVLSGSCVIGDGAFIGSGATIIQGIRIGKNSIIGAGAVVIKDVSDNTKVMGVPAKNCE